MLKIQEHLLSFNNYDEALKSIRGDYMIVKEYPDMIMLNYSSGTPKYGTMYDDCRGLILSKDFKDIYSFPFSRFYNYGEPGTEDFSFNDSVVYEKMDGSLIHIWFHPIKNTWNIATRGTAYAEGEVDSDGGSYRSLVLEALLLPKDMTDLDFTKWFIDFHINSDAYDINNIYVFELISPKNRVVKRYDETRLCFLGKRNKKQDSFVKSGCEYPFKYNKNIRTPDVYKCFDIVDITNLLENIEATDEGVVCFNPNTGQRVKCKNKKYVELAYMKYTGLNSTSSILNIISSQEEDEYLLYFPEDKHFFDGVRCALEALKIDIQHEYDKYVVDGINRKELANNIKDNKYRHFIFTMTSRHMTVDEVISSMPTNALSRILDRVV